MSEQKKPAPIFPSADQVPPELLGLSQWVGFLYKWDGHKWKKPPCSAVTGAEKDWPSSGVTFAEALAGALRLRLDGVGFSLEGYVGLDFDKCRDAATGEMDPEVLEWLVWFSRTYAEVSPSGTGVHVIAKGRLAKALTATLLTPGKSEATAEAYSHGRYFTVTGNRLDGAPMEAVDCQQSFDKLMKHLGKGGAEPEAGDSRPMTKRAARERHAANLAELRSVAEGAGNATLNNVALFAARAFCAGALDGTEKEVRDELERIVTKEWKSPHDTAGARATIESGWKCGAGKPLVLTEREPISTVPDRVQEMVKASEDALQAGAGLKYFERNSELVNIAYGRDLREKGIKRAADSVVIREASSETILRDLDSHASYFSLKRTKDGFEEVHVHVPKLLPWQMHDRVRSEPRDVPFPTLDLVTASPVLLPSGRVIQGVFEEGVLFVPGDRARFPAVPESPTKAEAAAALRQFEGVFGGFPFVDPGDETRAWNETASYSVVLAGVLSLAARPYLGLDSVPLIASHASTPRSGKTKIVEAISAAALGYRPTAAHFTDEAEFGKHLLPLMRAGDRAILIDNVERSLQSSKLCILITGGVLRDRILGESRDVTLKNYAVVFATGNNIVIGGDLSSRAVRADIDPGLERPETRAFGFDPVALALERHPRLVVAALTALRAFVLSGEQLRRAPWGGFERWDRLVSGCLTWLGYADPYETRDRVIGSDPVRMASADLLEEWHNRFGENETSFGEIRKAGGEVYEALLREGHWDGFHARLVLRRLEGRICNGYRLIRCQGRSVFRVAGPPKSQGKMPYEPFAPPTPVSR